MSNRILYLIGTDYSFAPKEYDAYNEDNSFLGVTLVDKTTFRTFGMKNWWSCGI